MKLSHVLKPDVGGAPKALNPPPDDDGGDPNASNKLVCCCGWGAGCCCCWEGAPNAAKLGWDCWAGWGADDPNGSKEFWAGAAAGTPNAFCVGAAAGAPNAFCAGAAAGAPNALKDPKPPACGGDPNWPEKKIITSTGVNIFSEYTNT